MLVCVTTRPLLETILEIHYVVSVVSGPVETVSIRSGITAGEVILMEGDDYIGHSVNVAGAPVRPGRRRGRRWPPRRSWRRCRAGASLLRETEVALRGVEKPVPATSIAMAAAGSDALYDPICGLPLSHDTAEEIAHDVRGSVVLFCSAGLRGHLAQAAGPRRRHLSAGRSAHDGRRRRRPSVRWAAISSTACPDAPISGDVDEDEPGKNSHAPHCSSRHVEQHGRLLAELRPDRRPHLQPRGASSCWPTRWPRPDGPHRLRSCQLGCFSLLASVGPFRLLGHAPRHRRGGPRSSSPSWAA